MLIGKQKRIGESTGGGLVGKSAEPNAVKIEK